VHDFACFGVAEIECDATFVSRRQQPVVVNRECTFELAVTVTRKRLDFDDICTVVREDGRCAGTGEIRSCVDDADAVE